jgi:hypothetical protein
LTLNTILSGSDALCLTTLNLPIIHRCLHLKFRTLAREGELARSYFSDETPVSRTTKKNIRILAASSRAPGAVYFELALALTLSPSIFHRIPTMFSPDVAGPSTAASLRNPRRRQRNQNEDSIKPPKAKRHRSALRNDTFTPLENVEVNAIARQANGELSVNGHAPAQSPTPASTRQTRSSGNTGLQELAYRPQKKQDKRAERGDGGVTLVRIHPRPLMDNDLTEL